MSNIKPDDFRKHAAEEDFFRLAAIEIESEQNEEFLEAQSLPDPSPEVLQRMQANLQVTMRRTRKRKRRHTIFLHLGRFTACAAVVCCILISGVYFNVDAARNSINNFVLELFDDHAVIKTADSTAENGATLPIDWDGPFYVTWVPSRYTSVRTKNAQTTWKLMYDESGTNNFSIFAWDAYHSPSINTENLTLVWEGKIQNASANIYFDPNTNTYMLIWIKSNYIFQIGGNICAEECKKIAENIVF